MVIVCVGGERGVVCEVDGFNEGWGECCDGNCGGGGEKDGSWVWE